MTLRVTLLSGSKNLSQDDIIPIPLKQKSIEFSHLYIRDKYLFIQRDLPRYVKQTGHEWFDLRELSGLQVEIILPETGHKLVEVSDLMDLDAGWEVLAIKNVKHIHHSLIMSTRENIDTQNTETDALSS